MIAEYSLDGKRLGGVAIKSITPSINDGRTEDQRAEAEAAPRACATRFPALYARYDSFAGQGEDQVPLGSRLSTSACGHRLTYAVSRPQVSLRTLRLLYSPADGRAVRCRLHEVQPNSSIRASKALPDSSVRSRVEHDHLGIVSNVGDRNRAFERRADQWLLSSTCSSRQSYQGSA